MGEFDDVNWHEYYRSRIAADAIMPVLPLRDRPCDDCAVTHGFYTPFAEGLSKLLEAMQVAASQKWDCHQTPRMACRGNVNLLATIRRRRSNGAK